MISGVALLLSFVCSLAVQGENPSNASRATLIAEVQPHRPSPTPDEYDAFASRYGRHHSRESAEYKERQALFRRRAQEVEMLNSRPKRRWTAGVNVFTDWTEKELAQLRGWRGGVSSSSSAAAGVTRGNLRSGLTLAQSSKGATLPEEFQNWTSLQTVKHVRDQGGCGSCWAFSASAVLDAHCEIYKPDRPCSFSPQELVSCTPNVHHCGGKGGCDGATVELAFRYVMHSGLSTEKETPYKGVDGTCSSTSSLLQGGGSDFSTSPGVYKGSANLAAAGGGGAAFGMVAWERLAENKYHDLLEALVQWGPVSVSVSASAWFSYRSGVFDDCKMDAVIDHAVVLVAYGSDATLGEKYWTIKNSWGQDWGEQGFIRLLRTDNEQEYCGVDKQPEVGTGCDGGPKEVQVCGMCGILYDSVVPHFVSGSAL